MRRIRRERESERERRETAEKETYSVERASERGKGGGHLGVRSRPILSVSGDAIDPATPQAQPLAFSPPTSQCANVFDPIRESVAAAVAHEQGPRATSRPFFFNQLIVFSSDQGKSQPLSRKEKRTLNFATTQTSRPSKFPRAHSFIFPFFRSKEPFPGEKAQRRPPAVTVVLLTCMNRDRHPVSQAKRGSYSYTQH